MFNYWGCGEGIRQNFSSIFLLFALSQDSKKKTFLFVCIAFLFHTTAIFFYLLFYLLRDYPKYGIAVIVLLCLASFTSLYAAFLFQYISFLPDFLSHKLAFYQYEFRKIVEHSVGVRNLVLPCLLLVGALYFRQYIDRRWFYVIVWYGIFVICTLFSLGHASGRIGGLYYMLFGFFFFIVFKKNIISLCLVGLLLFVWKLRDTYLFSTRIDTTHTGYQAPFYKYGLSGDWFYFLMQ